MSAHAVRYLMLTLAVEGIMGLFDSCIYGGTKYKDGDYFLPNDTIIKAEGPRQCVQCRCRQGLVLCEIEDCPMLDCEVPVQSSHLCCSHCPALLTVTESKVEGKVADSEEELEKSSDLVMETGEVDSENDSDSNCVSNGRRFRDGSSWQPVIGPFGVMACVECRCHRGIIICGRVRCGRTFCAQPRRQLGQCCPVCPRAAESRRKAFCLPKLNEVFVFRTRNVRNDSDRIEYAFLENARKNHLVNIHTWNLRPKNRTDVFTLSPVPRKEFLDRNLRLLGYISKKRFRKYSRREQKLMKNCLVNCLAKIERLERSLVEYYSLSAKSKCDEDEVDVGELLKGAERR